MMATAEYYKSRFSLVTKKDRSIMTCELKALSLCYFRSNIFRHSF